MHLAIANGARHHQLVEQSVKLGQLPPLEGRPVTGDRVL